MPSALFNAALLACWLRRGAVKRAGQVPVAAGGQIRWPRSGRFVSGYGQFLVAVVIE